VVLEGGTANRGLVVRVGDTVRRPRPVCADGVHALLDHLARRGFRGAPSFLRYDAQGREVLTYVEGEVPTAPPPAWALTDDVLVAVARLLRAYHDAARGFDAWGYDWPLRVPEAYRGDLVTHNDPNLDNVVFRTGRPVAFIDFDLASPADPVWDVALAARLWVPLRDPSDVPDERVGRLLPRLRLFVDAYGVDAVQRARVAQAVVDCHRWCYDIIRAGARAGQPGYAHYWTPMAQAHDARGHTWLSAHVTDMADALSR
jgi:Ser/Thr protein kinase RdoA (MazF antagonist)